MHKALTRTFAIAVNAPCTNGSKLLISACAFLLFCCAQVAAQPTELDLFRSETQNLSWQRGPDEGRIGKNASIQIPAGYFLLQAKDTSRFQALQGNFPSTNQYAFGPENFKWFAVFGFSETGYVKDDERIDPDQILASLKAENVKSNRKRSSRGIEPLVLEDWLVSPHYDPETNRMEWGTTLRSGGEVIVNYHIRLLARAGVMNALLVSDPEAFANDIRTFKAHLANFTFDIGQRYADSPPSRRDPRSASRHLSFSRNLLGFWRDAEPTNHGAIGYVRSSSATAYIREKP